MDLADDYRARSALARRAKMRARLMEAALIVLGRRGVEASIIDEIAAVANISRGTFYNYFTSNEDLLQAVAIETGNEMMRAVAPIVESDPDPAWRVAAGVRGWLALTGRYPHLAAFFRRAGLYILEQDSEVRVDMPRDLMTGIASGRFSIGTLELGFDIVAGTTLSAINTIAVGRPAATHGQEVACRILMALGVPASEAALIATLDIAEAKLADNSLILGSARRLKAGTATGR